MTIKDVANKSGVSVSTVSRVLNNHPDVSENVRKKVMEVVEALHYVPNNSARDLTLSQTNSIGVVVRGADNPFFTAMISAMEQEFEKNKYTMVLSQIKAGDDELLAGASLARSKRLKGLIFLGGCFDYTQQQADMLDIPFVCCTYTNDFGSLDPESYSSISIDDQTEARRAVKYLIDHGHRKIAVLLDSKTDSSISELRYRGYIEALEEAGIVPDPDLVEEVTYYDMAAAYEGTRRLLERRPDLTAIFIIADSMAIAAMKALHEAGRSVPDDCSIIAIDGIEMSLYTIPTLTTLIQPREEMGREAVKALVNVIEGKGGHCHLRFDTILRPGGTVADVKA